MPGIQPASRDVTSDPFLIDQIPAACRWPVEAALAIPALRRIYRRIGDGEHNSRDEFETRVLRALDVRPDATDADLMAIPDRGPAVIAANHPHGALDGLLLLDLVRRVRPDVRVLANRFLERIPELRESCFFVDPFDGPEAAARSRAGLRAAHLWLRRGGAMIVFPAGEVGHTWIDGALADSPWHATFERLADATGARIVRAFIDGRNSWMFYAAGRLHPWLRTALLGRELLKKRGQTIRVRIGEHDEIAREIERLDERACLAESGALRVFCATADAIPSTLREIGRLREITFRAVGEGTGRSIDLDEFDRSYLHLFAWDAEQRQIVGAYRIGRSDRIASTVGVDGLYTRTLFNYDERLLNRLGAPALELGRSFVRAEYQKTHSALLLLWRGIGAFVARHPRYRFLFGPVSISERYSDASRAMLIAFLRQHHLDRELADLVDAVTPPRFAASTERSLPEEMPVLLRQYLKLNARLIGVNVDRDFSNAVDALMVVDLLTVGRSVLARYMGKDAAARYQTWHARRERSIAA